VRRERFCVPSYDHGNQLYCNFPEESAAIVGMENNVLIYDIRQARWAKNHSIGEGRVARWVLGV
jgi:hypothetical protein